MPLDIGDWTINVSGTINGIMGVLTIDSVDSQGNISGSVFGDPIHGNWDEGTQAIAFARLTQSFAEFYVGTKIMGIWLNGSSQQIYASPTGSKKWPFAATKPPLRWVAQPGCG